jgi:Gram-negative porin
MKKLMLSTALVGALVSGSALAQTTITGELRLSYKATESSVASGTTTASQRGFGSEQQINVQTKGKLNVGGLEYAAGFAIENDGEQATTLFNENTYMDITNPGSKTTISFSRDHVIRGDSSKSDGVIFGFDPNDLTLTVGSGTATRFNQSPGPAVGQQYSMAIIQNTPVGNFIYNYAPTAGASASASSETAAETDNESGYEYGFDGDLGVKGLHAYYLKSAEKVQAGKTVKAEALNWGAKYNFGQATVGYTKKVYNTAHTSLNEITENHYGAAYAVNKDLSVGLLYAKAESSGAGASNTSVTEKTKAIQVGYNLGPVSLTAAAAKNSDVGGIAGQDQDVVMFRLIGAF